MKREMGIICDAFSSQRLGKYMRLYDGDEAKAVAHYKANLALAESLYTSLSVFELTLWKGLRLAFPHMPKKDRKRKNVSSPCNALRKLRNRVFHHESICWDLDYITEIHDRLILVLGWMNSDMPAWLEKVDNFSKVVDEIRNSSAGLKV